MDSRLSMIDVGKVDSARLETLPYEYITVSNFIRDEWKDKLIETYPKLKAAGSFPLTTVTCSREFKQLIDEMNSGAFRRAIASKFSVDLEGKPTMFTVRGKCRSKDGQVHTDSESKIITVLLYMNPSWENQGGRLRVLNSNNIEDIKTEIPPDVGTLLVFKRSDRSYHGHLPFEGPRKVIQMNWVTHQKFVDQEQKRHRFSALFKMFSSY
ncbi:MAG: 2OG-Fe(II) oxygenase [Candidatus Omnitrophica bacterium]|nr:2OG-Fe(II) oxygenase [Candidatus Omnitrophota bacterium]MDE2010038.1 2OG-Fe(II) oxygenase [Candidatus Omnitrophota bacterium]MDE2214727.1 2OG-Fe(II) oxygenase [Candidatus Omnitrophota bacterium]MDE2231790.1 2OG-Fe(II) oxygenase [Candidatus Omnitrophota bacterium]